MATISQRISLEGSEDIRKKLEALGKAGEKAFKQIQDAAKKPITDPAQVDRTRQAVDQLVTAVAKLGPQFSSLNAETQKFGNAGPRAFENTARDANNLGIRIGVIAGVVTALTNKLLSMAGALKAALSPGDLLKGTVDTGKAISDQAEKLKLTVPEWLKLSKAIAAAGVSEEAFIAGTKKLAGTIADAKGGFVSIGAGQLVSTSKGAVAVMRDLAEAISRIGNEAEKARQGTAAFGENWKEIIKALTGGKAAAADLDDVFDRLAKVDRAMGPEQAEKAARLAKGWDVLGKAIRAAKDQIGTVFIDSALLRAEWLIKLIDGARELFKTWQQLAEAKKAAFLEGLGESPAEMVFKTLIAVGDQLAGIWRDVLVPAGKALMGIIGGIAGQFEGVSKSQVAAFFITAAAAAVGLALALKGLSLLLTPLSLLLGLFSPFGAVLIAVGAAVVLFWDQISAGAAKAASLVPESVAQIAASFQKLFAGDFAGFWDQFSAAALVAFQAIGQAIMQADGPSGELVRSLLAGFRQIATDGPAALALVVQGLIALGNAATTVANFINMIFGTQLTGTDVGLILVIGQLTGGLQALAAVATIAGVALAAIGTVIATLVALIGGIPVAIGLVAVALAGAAAAWVTFSDTGKSAIAAIGNSIDWLIEKIKTAARWLGSMFSSGGGAAPAGAAPGFARGGTVGGRGSGTSDSNLAWVSRGEHIMPARSVRQPGVLAFLEALRRSGGNLAHVLDRMGHFAMGGPVGMPAIASGGIGGMSHVTIQFPGLPAVTGLRASSDVVDELRKAAAMAQVRSGGRKPSRYT